MTDGRSVTGLSRRRESLGLFGRSRKRPKRYGTGRLLHGRLASEVGNSPCESLRGMQFSLAVEFDVVHLGMHGRRDPHGSLIPGGIDKIEP